MQWLAISFLLATQALFSYAHPAALTKRAAETNATLVAYGNDISAWPVVYGDDDGSLYISQNFTDNNSTVSTSIVFWDLPSITGENWIVNATFSNGTAAGSMYILPEDGKAVGVLPAARISEVNGTITGFALFATQLVYNDNTYLEAQFWAKPVTGTNIYQLIWVDTYDSITAGSFPVVIKGVEDY